LRVRGIENPWNITIVIGSHITFFIGFALRFQPQDLSPHFTLLYCLTTIT